jgi:O-acetyl-ADP-ribose deacetylase (regulator of RNase III)/uncharacterized protein YwgA
MISVRIGDMFESQAQTLVNTVNCVGVMGKGVALEFKKRFPDMFEDYAARCRHHQVRLGEPYLYKRLLPPWVLNFPTKGDWRSVANLHEIIRGLDYLESRYREWGIESLAVPPLGCGHGQLEWRVVGPTLYRHLSRLTIPVELYAPHGTPHEELQPSFLGASAADAPPMPEPAHIRPEWVAIVDVLYRLEQQPYHFPVGRTTFQKIAFVLTEEGLNTGLEYRQGSYGPYAPAVKPMLGRLMNNGLIEEQELGRMLEVHTGRTFPDARRAYARQLEPLEPILERTADLFHRFQTTKQAEIVSTILYSANQVARAKRSRPAEKEVMDYVLSWKQRRRPPVDAGEVAHHIRNLAALGRLDVEPSEDLPVPDDELAEV